MYKENLWQQPTAGIGLFNTGMHHILKEAVTRYLLNWDHEFSRRGVDNVIIHSYKETGTALTVNAEIYYTCPFFGSQVKFKRILL